MVLVLFQSKKDLAIALQQNCATCVLLFFCSVYLNFLYHCVRLTLFIKSLLSCVKFKDTGVWYGKITTQLLRSNTTIE